MLGCFFNPNAGLRPLGKGDGLKIGLDHNPAVLGWERGPEREHARHVNVRRHQCEKPPFSQPERSEKRVKGVMV